MESSTTSRRRGKWFQARTRSHTKVAPSKGMPSSEKSPSNGGATGKISFQHLGGKDRAESIVTHFVGGFFLAEQGGTLIRKRGSLKITCQNLSLRWRVVRPKSTQTGKGSQTGRLGGRRLSSARRGTRVLMKDAPEADSWSRDQKDRPGPKKGPSSLRQKKEWAAIGFACWRVLGKVVDGHPRDCLRERKKRSWYSPIVGGA